MADEGRASARFAPAGLPTSGQPVALHVGTSQPGVVRTWRGIPAGERQLKVVWDGGRFHTRAAHAVFTRFVRR